MDVAAMCLFKPMDCAFLLFFFLIVFFFFPPFTVFFLVLVVFFFFGFWVFFFDPFFDEFGPAVTVVEQLDDEELEEHDEDELEEEDEELQYFFLCFLRFLQTGGHGGCITSWFGMGGVGLSAGGIAMGVLVVVVGTRGINVHATTPMVIPNATTHQGHV